MLINRHLVEIGCSGKASLHNFLEPESLLEIFEPNPKHLAAIRQTYAGYPNVIIHPYALWKERGEVRFHEQGVTSFVEGVRSPAVSNNWPVADCGLTVEARTFDEFDDGTITMMDIDTEGAEWYVLERMKSRPGVIMIEMQWLEYRNPHFNEIVNWMEANYYYNFHEDGGSFFYRRLA
jgi:FkbM family methyltransferase